MKVVFLLSSFPKISETFILSQITDFIDLGVDVEILAFKQVHTNEVHELVNQYQLMDKVKYLSSDNKILRGLKIFSTILRYPLKAGHLLNVGRYHLITSLRSLELLGHIKEISDCQALIAHYGPNGATIANLQSVNVLPTLKLITFFHGFDLTAFVKKNGTKPYRQLLMQKNRILAINNIFRNRLIELGANKENVLVHHMGVDIDLFKYQTHTINRPLKIVSVGRLVEKKGFDTTIKIIKKLVDSGIDTQLTIVGDGPLRKQLESQIVELHLQNYVTLQGSRSQQQVHQQMIESDFFILMSKTSTNGDKEGIPVVLMEAMATGLPIISTIHSGIPELVEDKTSGWLVKENDVTAAFNVIKDIYQNPQILRTISMNARKKIEKEFNSQLLSQKLLQLCLEGDVRSNEQ